MMTADNNASITRQFRVRKPTTTPTISSITASLRSCPPARGVSLTSPLRRIQELSEDDETTTTTRAAKRQVAQPIINIHIPFTNDRDYEYTDFAQPRPAPRPPVYHYAHFPPTPIERRVPDAPESPVAGSFWASSPSPLRQNFAVEEVDEEVQQWDESVLGTPEFSHPPLPIAVTSPQTDYSVMPSDTDSPASVASTLPTTPCSSEDESIHPVAIKPLDIVKRRNRRASQIFFRSPRASIPDVSSSTLEWYTAQLSGLLLSTDEQEEKKELEPTPEPVANEPRAHRPLPLIPLSRLSISIPRYGYAYSAGKVTVSSPPDSASPSDIIPNTLLVPKRSIRRPPPRVSIPVDLDLDDEFDLDSSPGPESTRLGSFFASSLASSPSTASTASPFIIEHISASSSSVYSQSSSADIREGEVSSGVPVVVVVRDSASIEEDVCVGSDEDKPKTPRKVSSKKLQRILGVTHVEVSCDGHAVPRAGISENPHSSTSSLSVGGAYDGDCDYDNDVVVGSGGRVLKSQWSTSTLASVSIRESRKKTFSSRSKGKKQPKSAAPPSAGWKERLIASVVGISSSSSSSSSQPHFAPTPTLPSFQLSPVKGDAYYLATPQMGTRSTRSLEELSFTPSPSRPTHVHSNSMTSTMTPPRPSRPVPLTPSPRAHSPACSDASWSNESDSCESNLSERSSTGSMRRKPIPVGLFIR